MPVLQPSASQPNLCSPQTKKILQKKKPLPWLSQNNQDPYADDYDKYTPWQRNEEKIKTMQAVAKIVAEAIFSVHSSLDLLREVFKLIYLLQKQKPLSHPDHGCG